MADSGYGDLCRVESGELTRIVNLPGWTRGLSIVDDLAIVGTSRIIRRTAQYAPGVDLDRARCGLHLVDLATGDGPGFVDLAGGRSDLRDRLDLPGAVPGFPRRPARPRCGCGRIGLVPIRTAGANGPHDRRCCRRRTEGVRRLTDTEMSLVMIGAMYENGGNTTHRHLDGHPELFVYPFESQLGSRAVNDQWTGMFPAKYRWPVFDLSGSARSDFFAFIDEETRVRARTPHVSKFRDWPFDFDDDERGARFEEIVAGSPRTRAGNVLAFFEATFDTWRDVQRSGSERWWVGYSPVLVVDAPVILDELPDAHFVHVVRNPWSGYADTKKRPVPLDLETYMVQWSINQYLAGAVARRHRDRMHIVRLEDVVSDPQAALGPLCAALGIDGTHPALEAASWNGKPLTEVFPWGTIRSATTEANEATAGELSTAEREAIELLAGPWLELLGYSTDG